jgi:purine-binding chemotaxis protein CheW
MSAVAPLPTQAVRVCLITLAGTPFAIDVRAAKEIVVLDDCTPVPQGPPQLLGVANLRGAVIPILDIQPLLKLPRRQRTGRITALVVAWENRPVAIAVDAVLGLELFGEVLSFSEAAQADFGEYAVGLLPHLDGFVTLLDVPRVVGALRDQTPRRPRAVPAEGGQGQILR